MARCKRCGIDLGYRPGRRVCHKCMKIWQTNRTKAFDQAVSEIGPLSNENLRAIQKRVKSLEKTYKAQG